MTSLLLLIWLFNKTQAQALAVEMMLGTKNYYHQFNYFKSLPHSRLGFFNTSSALFFPRPSPYTELMSQTYATFHVLKTLKIGLGYFYASVPGLKPSLNIQFFKSTKQYSFILVPRIDLTCAYTYNLMSALEYKPALSTRINLYTRIQTMFNYRDKQHNRSYQYLRLGLERGRNQFGIAMNRDSYGMEYRNNINYGIFYKTTL